MPPLVVLGLAWLGGIAFVALWGAPVWLLPLAIAVLIPAAFAASVRFSTGWIAAAALLALAGGWQHEVWLERDLPPLAYYRGEEVELAGRVVSLPDPGLTVSRHTVEVDEIRIDGEPREASGKVLLTLGEYARFAIGTHIEVSGELEEPPVLPDFDYRGYLERQGIVATMFFPEVTVLDRAGWSVDRIIAETRLELDDAVQRALPEPEASLATGIALGRDGTLPDDLYEDYRRSGLAHIIAVSGSNVALLTGMVFLAAVPAVGRRWAIAPAAGIVAVYVLVAGADAAVMRAGIMAGVFLVGMALGRQQSGIAALSLAAILMLAFDPAMAADLGFQLSLAATAGLLVLAPWIEWGLLRVAGPVAPAIPRSLVQISSWSLAATVATAPLLWLNFGELSVVGVLANLLVEPVFAMALGLSLVTAVAGALWEPLGSLFGLAAWYPLALINWLAATLGSPGWASVHVSGANGTGAAFAYVVLIAAGAFAYYRPPAEEPYVAQPGWLLPVRRYATAGGLGAGFLAVIWWSILPAEGPGELRIHFFDVGQGDAALITTPNGERLLIDGGPSGIRLMQELGEVLPHWERDIEHVFLTHPQQDHLAGLVELHRRMDVGVSYATTSTSESATYELLSEEWGSPHIVHSGREMEIDGVLLHVLWPQIGSDRRDGDLNNNSLVLLMEYAGRRIWFTGDIEAETQRMLMLSLRDLSADVLKVPHHGAATSDPGFFAALDPEIAVISAGEGNRFGHPREETLMALGDAEVLRTDLDGRITVTIASDGKISYERER